MENTIISALIDNLEDLTEENGFEWTITSVHEWRESDLDETELDAIVIKDISNEPYEDDELQHLLTVEATLISTGGTDPATHRDQVQDMITQLSLIENTSGVSGAMFMGLERDSEKGKKRFMKTLVRIGIIYSAERWEI